MRTTWTRFSADWRTLPSPARRKFLGWLAGGWLACAALAVALAFAARALAEGGLDSWDRSALQSMVESSPMSFQAAIWFEGWGSSAMLIPVAIVAAVIAARLRRSLYAIGILAAYVLHDPLVMLIHQVWPRVRPDLVAGGIASPPLDAFPSGHTVQVIAVYGLLAWFWGRRSRHGVERILVVVLLAVVTGIVGYARLRLGTHWPSDVIGAVPLGLAWLFVCIAAIRSAERVAGLAPSDTGGTPRD